MGKALTLNIRSVCHPPQPAQSRFNDTKLPYMTGGNESCNLTIDQVGNSAARHRGLSASGIKGIRCPRPWWALTEMTGTKIRAG
jgi:hypothetical protein